MILDQSTLLFGMLRLLVSTIFVCGSAKEAFHTPTQGWVNLTATRCETATAAATLYLLKLIQASSDSVSQPTLSRPSIPVRGSFASANLRETPSARQLSIEKEFVFRGRGSSRGWHLFLERPSSRSLGYSSWVYPRNSSNLTTFSCRINTVRRCRCPLPLILASLL